MDDTPKQTTKPQLRATTYARLSETYNPAESVPTQLANAYAAGFLSWLAFSLGGRRRIAASIATAAES
jgi:hypothetical protein